MYSKLLNPIKRGVDLRTVFPYDAEEDIKRLEEALQKTDEADIRIVRENLKYGDKDAEERLAIWIYEYEMDGDVTFMDYQWQGYFETPESFCEWYFGIENAVAEYVDWERLTSDMAEQFAFFETKYGYCVFRYAL